MPIVRREDIPMEAEGRLRRQPIARSDLGAVSLTVTEITMLPGGQIPLHIHPGHEECIMVLAGTLEVVLGDEKKTVAAGYTIIAPDSVKHSLTNISNRPARILAIFPTTDVQRKFLE